MVLLYLSAGGLVDVRNLVPDQDDANIDLGRFIQENTYQREKEISLGNIKLDILRNEKDS